MLIIGSQVGWGTIWREGFIRPFLNFLLFLYTYLGHSFVIAIAVFTLVVRLLTLPLQLQQNRATRRMTAMQPRLKELQTKYGGDQQRMALEQQKLYKEAGVNPLSGCLTSFIQFPIWIALYQAINAMLADSPIELMNLGLNVYQSLPGFVNLIPIQSRFLWMNLAQPDPSPIIMPILVGGTMWLQQKMMTQPSSDPQTASMNQTMQIMMPLMFGYFTTQFASGLALYFLISNVIGIVTQLIVDRIDGPVKPLPAAVTAPANTVKNEVTHGRKKQRRKAKR
ncbi:MAG: YidC/Oxa1 family membrane protein insertase [Chloroflexi bacterium]|nr:YidC/Oxa1 family membrane protein insertase [Chloroflexota bacterium]